MSSRSHRRLFALKMPTNSTCPRHRTSLDRSTPRSRETCLTWSSQRSWTTWERCWLVLMCVTRVPNLSLALLQAPTKRWVSTTASTSSRPRARRLSKLRWRTLSRRPSRCLNRTTIVSFPPITSSSETVSVMLSAIRSSAERSLSSVRPSPRCTTRLAWCPR